jgi:hypothetical protein
MGFENVAVTAASMATPVAWSEGLVPVTSGAAWMVVKLHERSVARGPVFTPFAPVVMVAV